MGRSLSIIIPAYNAERTLPRLLSTVAGQLDDRCEAIVVDDASTDGTPRLVSRYPVRHHRLECNSGPAAARNAGAARARGDALAFTDSDCWLAPDWVRRIRSRLEAAPDRAIMGRLILTPSTLIGNAISALGFPAGGSVGFDKIWPVDDNGDTRSLSTCNCAVARSIFMDSGGFDTDFPFAGGEDSLLAYRLIASGCRIRYCPEVVAHHEARSDLGGFLRWQYKRGKSSYVFARKVKRKGSFLKLRLWSSANVLRAAAATPRLALVALLLGTSIGVQYIGYLAAKHDRTLNERIDH